MAFSTPTPKSKLKGGQKPKTHPEFLPVFERYEHFTKVHLEGYDYFQGCTTNEDSMSWLCGRTRKTMKCGAQLTIFRDGTFTRFKKHNHVAVSSNGVRETTSWQTYMVGLCQVFARMSEKKNIGDKMYHGGHEYVCKSYLNGRCYWNCVELNTGHKCLARLSTWYDGVVIKVSNREHNHEAPQLTPGQRVQQQYDAWFPKQWAAPQLPPPPPKPVQQPPQQQQQQQPQLKRPMMMKPLAPKPRPASPPQPPPPPPEVCLRWNSYHSNMQATFPALLNNEQFVDVTLACEGRSIKCHKMILSACSSYFDELLSQNPCQHPIVLMKDLKFWEVQALVEFMYRGEVNVGQDKLPFLLAAAEALQIKGLASPTSSTPQHDEDSTSLGMDLDYADEYEAPSPSSARRSRKRRTIAAMPVRTPPPPPAPAPAVRSARLQRNLNNNNNNTHHQHRSNMLAQPSTSGYVPTVHEPPTRRRRMEVAEFDVGDHVMREIKLEPVDIDASSDSTDHPAAELFQLTCEPTAPTFHPDPDRPTDREEDKSEENRPDDDQPTPGNDEEEEEEEDEGETKPEPQDEDFKTHEEEKRYEATERTTVATTDDDGVCENGPPHDDGDNAVSDDGTEDVATPTEDVADPVLKPGDSETHEDDSDEPPCSDIPPTTDEN